MEKIPKEDEKEFKEFAEHDSDYFREKFFKLLKQVKDKKLREELITCFLSYHHKLIMEIDKITDLKPEIKKKFKLDK